MGNDPYRTARRWIAFQQSPTGTGNCTPLHTTYQDAGATYSSVMSGFPMFNFSPVTISVTVNSSVYIRVLDFYQLFTTPAAVGTPAYQSPNWILRDGSTTRVWDGVTILSRTSGYTYYPGACVLAKG